MQELNLKAILDTNYINANIPPQEAIDMLNNLIILFKDILTNEDPLILNEEEKGLFSMVSYLLNLSSKKNYILGKQIDEIIHHPSFSRLEGRWRGLENFVKNTVTSEDLQIKVLNISKKELNKDLTRNDWDQSVLFKTIYEHELGTYGGDPFSCMIYDEYFGSTTPDIEFIQKLTSVCAAAHCVCVSGADPSFFNFEDFSKLNQTRDIYKTLQHKIAWKSYRTTEDSRYFSLVLPKFMIRPPYSNLNHPAENISYDETVDGNSLDNFAWANSAYLLGSRITEAYEQFGWTAAIRGVEGGGKTRDLPVYLYTKAQGETVIKCPTEISVTDRKEKELADLGFIPICHCKGTNYAVFFSTQTCQKPELYSSAGANANSKLSTCLQYVLLVSRFAHYVKVILRNTIGTFQTKEEIQTKLQSWLSEYVLLNNNASQELKSQMPLRAALVLVEEVPGTIGTYNVIMWISPHLQLDEIDVSIRLVAKIPTK